MPDRYVLDAHAWVEYLRGSSPGARVKKIVESAELFTSPLTLAEVLAHVQAQGGDPDTASRAILTLSDIVEIDSAIAIDAARRAAGGPKNALSQAYTLEIAKKMGANILSGDKSFVSARVRNVREE